MEAPAGSAASVRVLPRVPHPSSSTPLVSSSAPARPPLDGIVAVGFIGSSSSTDPTQLINRILDSNIFGSGRADKDIVPRSDWFAHRRISYHHDSDKGVVFLQFSSCLNPLEALSLSGSDCVADGPVLEESELEDLKGMLFIFSVCHIIIFLHEGLRFDTQILKKFRVLQSAKHALLPFIKSQTTPNSNSNSDSATPQFSHLVPRGNLSGRHLSSSSPHPSAQFSPVILFVFEDNFSDTLISVPTTSAENSVKSSSNKKRLISSLESQIRFLVKKLHLSSRVSSNSNYTPLFSLDASRSVSLLDQLTNQKGEPLNYVLNLINSAGSNLINESTSHFTNNEEVQVIWDFISRHSEILRGRGAGVSGNPNPGSVSGVGMVAAAAIAAATSTGTVKPVTGLYLPGLDSWLALSKSILNSLISSKNGNENINNDMEGALCNLERSKGVNAKFSVSWCEKALPVCKDAYLKDLPKYYRTDTHKEQLKRALELFYATVKGPAVNKFAKKLEKECDFIWQNRRQQCDESSLTGRFCIHPKHSSDSKGDSVISQHSSGYYFLHACACGRSRALRDDPFEFETGRESFNVFPKCEKLVPTIEIPSVGTSGTWRLVRIGSAKYYNPQNGILQTGFCSNEKFLFCWKLKSGIIKNSDNNELIRERSEFNIEKKVSANFIMKKPFAEVVKGGENKNACHEEKGNVLQIGSNIISVNTKNVGTEVNNSVQDFVAYLGFEHECPYGHRFLLSEQHLKQLDSPVSHERNSGNKRGLSAKSLQSNRKQNNQLSGTSDNDEKCSDNNNSNTFSILTRKLPIFMNCPHCSQSEKRDLQKIRFAGTVSQLQRIFIVTPQFPVLLASCPVVQFEDSCLPDSVLSREQESRFGFGSRVMLPPDSFLTLRLPFIYGVKTGDGSLYPLNPFKTRPDKTAWLVEGTALQLVSVGNCSKEV